MTPLPLPRSFYERSPEIVARELLGKVLVSRFRGRVLAGRIVEAEAYLGPHKEPVDHAAHAHRGPTPRTAVLFGPAGHAYVYAIYGQYFCMNVSCEPEGQAGCVLLRALEPLEGFEAMARNRGVELKSGEKSLVALTSGPGRLCQALGIRRETHNGLDLAGLDVTASGGRLTILDDGFVAKETRVTARVGIHPKNDAVDWPLRFCMAGSSFVSGPKWKARRSKTAVA